MMLRLLGAGLGMTAMGMADPEKPGLEVMPPEVVEKDRGLYVFPKETELSENSLVKPGQDLMLKRLMAEMMKEAEQDKKEMEAPVEMPKLDAQELQRLLRGMDQQLMVPTVRRWTLGVYLPSDPEDEIVVDVVIPDSPAEAADLKVGDVLLDVNGIQLRNHEMLVELFQVIRDQEVELGLRRKGADAKVKITAREMDLPDVNAWKFVPPEVPVAPKPKVMPEKDERDDEVLKELRGMRQLMEQMLQELKKQRVPQQTRPRVRRVPTPPQNQ